MIALLVIGLVIFIIKVTIFSIRAAWGVTKILLFVLGVPVLLIALIIIGLTFLAVPLLIAALLAAFIVPKLVEK